MASSDAFDIKDSIVNSVTDLFGTMLDLEVETIDPERFKGIEGPRMIGSLSFAGEVVGSINLQVTFETGRLMTAAMLGMEVEEIETEEEVRDVIREACNIVGGNLKSGLEDVGLACAISTPSITTGDDFEIETLNMDRYERFGFQWDENQLQVELAVKAAEGVDEEARAKLTAVDLSKFSRLDIIASTGDTVLELFDVMLDLKLDMSDHAAMPKTGKLMYQGAVAFAGTVTGTTSIQIGETFARVMTAKIMGVPPDEVTDEDEIKDVIGEATNIIAGNLKAAFNDSGLECKISPPNITIGTDFTVDQVNMDRLEKYAFAYNDHDVFVQVCVKIDDGVTGLEDAPAQQSVEEAQAEIDAMLPGSDDAEDDDGGAVEAEAADEELSEDVLDMLLDIPLQLTVELGRTKMKVEELLKMGPGSTIIHANLDGEPLEVLANDTLIARGEVVVEGEKYGIRITEIVSSRERIESLRRDPLEDAAE